MQAFAVGVHVGNRAQCHAAVCRRLGHRWRDLHHQARVKRLGNQVLRPESQLFAGIGGSHHLALLGLGQLGDGVHRRDFHLDRDGRGAGIQGATENIGKTQDVVDLVRVVGAAGGHHGVTAHCLDVFRGDFGIWVGQGKNDGVRCHLLNHGRFEHTTGGQPEKNVGVRNDVTQGSRFGFLGKDDFVLVHQLGTALVHHPCQVGDKNILARYAQLDQEAQAGQRRRPGA